MATRFLRLDLGRWSQVMAVYSRLLVLTYPGVQGRMLSEQTLIRDQVDIVTCRAIVRCAANVWISRMILMSICICITLRNMPLHTTITHQHPHHPPSPSQPANSTHSPPAQTRTDPY